jgi:hypothetical protein
MIAVHWITPELADYHTAGMTDADLEFRLQMYARLGLTAGMELSVVGPNLRAGNAVSTRFLRPATMTAGPRHSTPFPADGGEAKTAPVMPDSEVRNRGRNRGRFLPPREVVSQALATDAECGDM